LQEKDRNKQHAHRLLDRLDPGQFEAEARLLEVMTEARTVPIAESQ
jgi:hypothetical protein